MTEANQVLELLIMTCPDFRQYWQENGDLFQDKDGHISAHGVFAVFSWFVAEKLQARNYSEMPRVFDLVERLMAQGSDKAQNAAATCFLETLVNRIPTTLPPTSFVRFLGPLSFDFCEICNGGPLA